MKKSTKFLFFILFSGLAYSFYEAVTGQGGSGLYDFIDAIVYSSVVLFVAALIVIVINIKNFKNHWDTVIFLLVALPLTMAAIQDELAYRYYNRAPDLSVKYPLPVDREQYINDSTNIKLAIDSLIALRNRAYGGMDVAYGVIDTIIYSEGGDKIFVSYMKKIEESDWKNGWMPDCLAADGRDSIFWRLTPAQHSMTGTFENTASLKIEVRKYYFNQFSFLDKDSTAGNYLWKVVL